jgi:hypothetical protein
MREEKKNMIEDYSNYIVKYLYDYFLITIVGAIVVGAWVTINCISICHWRTSAACCSGALNLYYVLLPILP